MPKGPIVAVKQVTMVVVAMLTLVIYQVTPNINTPAIDPCLNRLAPDTVVPTSENKHLVASS